MVWKTVVQAELTSPSRNELYQRTLCYDDGIAKAIHAKIIAANTRGLFIRASIGSHTSIPATHGRHSSTFGFVPHIAPSISLRDVV